LLDRRAVEEEQFKAARVIRDAVLNIPDRTSGAIAAVLAAECKRLGVPADVRESFSQADVHRIVSGEIRKILESAADSLAEGA
jgi:hypothetical protein